MVQIIVFLYPTLNPPCDTTDTLTIPKKDNFQLMFVTSLFGLCGFINRQGCPALDSTTCESPNQAT